MSWTLGGAVAAAGAKGVSKVASARSGYHDVARTAIQVHGAAEAQQRAHEHTLKTLRQVHKMAGEGTNVRLKVNADGTHDLGYSKKMIGENLREREEGYRIKDMDRKAKDYFGNNGAAAPSHDAAGFRTATPQHYTNAIEGADARRELTAPRKAITAGNPPKTYTPARGGRVVGMPDAERVNGAIPMGAGTAAGELSAAAKGKKPRKAK